MLVTSIFSIFHRINNLFPKTNFRLFQSDSLLTLILILMKMTKFFKRVENTVGKGKFTCYEQFLLFPPVYKRLVITRACLGKGLKQSTILEKISTTCDLSSVCFFSCTFYLVYGKYFISLPVLSETKHLQQTC